MDTSKQTNPFVLTKEFNDELFCIARRQIYESMECKHGRRAEHGFTVNGCVYQSIFYFIARAYIYEKTKNSIHLKYLDESVSNIRHDFAMAPKNYLRHFFEKDKRELFNVSAFTDAEVYFGSPPVISRQVVADIFECFENLATDHPGY